MESQNSGRFWPLSPRLWRRSNEYSKVVFEPRRPPISPIEIRRRIENPPDLLRSRYSERLDHLNLEEYKEKRLEKQSLHVEEYGERRWDKKPPLKEKEKEKERKEEVVKLRVKKQRQPRPNSLQLLLCPNNSGHYSSSTWRYTRVRSKRFVQFTFLFKNNNGFYHNYIGIVPIVGLVHLSTKRRRK